MRELCYGESTDVCLQYRFEFCVFVEVRRCCCAAFSPRKSLSVDLLALFWRLLRCVYGVEPKPSCDRRGERRVGEQAEDGRIIMRPAFLVALGFGVSGRAGRSR